jgi:hypothetical protein
MGWGHEGAGRAVHTPTKRKRLRAPASRARRDTVRRSHCADTNASAAAPTHFQVGVCVSLVHQKSVTTYIAPLPHE